LFIEPIVFAAHRDHPLAGRRNVTMQEIENHLILGPERGATIWGDIDKFLMKNGKREFRQVLMSSSYDFSRAYMRRTDAIACLSRSIMGPELESGEFVQLDIPVDEMLGSVGITYRTGTRMAPHVRTLFDLFREKARALYS
jgi:LysR family pca operon transcriptional activator